MRPSLPPGAVNAQVRRAEARKVMGTKLRRLTRVRMARARAREPTLLRWPSLTRRRSVRASFGVRARTIGIGPGVSNQKEGGRTKGLDEDVVEAGSDYGAGEKNGKNEGRFGGEKREQSGNHFVNFWTHC